ncbi:hypothetical protein C9H74_15275, partial [Clostridioides difficile]|nr:hypothetical protein [Clostridioides difficile]HAU5129405.1 hypothetical protein [Clostridioides difficile]HAU5382931.1 hypothetical protein [Clostridioides difficile]
NLCKNRRNYGDSLWRISKTYFSMQNSMKQELCDFSHWRFRRKSYYHHEKSHKVALTCSNIQVHLHHMRFLVLYIDLSK